MNAHEMERSSSPATNVQEHAKTRSFRRERGINIWQLNVASTRQLRQDFAPRVIADTAARNDMAHLDLG